MRSLFWDRLPDGRVEGTFWEKHVPAYAQLDLKEAEGLFQAMQRKTGAWLAHSLLAGSAVMVFKHLTEDERTHRLFQMVE